MNALRVAWKDILILLKDRGQIILLFVLPMVFIVAFGAAMSAGQEKHLIAVPVVNLDAGGEMSKSLIELLNSGRGLKTEGYDGALVENDLQEKKINMALYIPAGFTANIQAGQAAPDREPGNTLPARPSHSLAQ
jgi:ABC-type Na+ efflux pump permease subunit